MDFTLFIPALLVFVSSLGGAILGGFFVLYRMDKLMRKDEPTKVIHKSTIPIVDNSPAPAVGVTMQPAIPKAKPTQSRILHYPKPEVVRKQKEQQTISEMLKEAEEVKKQFPGGTIDAGGLV